MVNGKPLLSIITPVYNVERYLDRCIASIQSQSFQDWELILIDDGSTDNSGSICDGYAAKDTRIRVFHQSNSGASAARNVGLDYAQGELITFVDSDDDIAPETYERNIRHLQSDTSIDMVVFPIVRDGFVHDVDVSLGRNKKDIKSIFDVWYSHYPMQSSLCNKIIKRNVIGDVRFLEGKVTGEDLSFASQLWDKMNHVYVSSEGAYYYNSQNENSVTKVYDQKRMSEKVDEMGIFTRHIHKHEELREYALPFFVGRTIELFKEYIAHNHQMNQEDSYALSNNRPPIRCLFVGGANFPDIVHYLTFFLFGIRASYTLYKKTHHLS